VYTFDDLLNSDISNIASLVRRGWTTVNNEEERAVDDFNIRKYAWSDKKHMGASLMRLGVEAEIQNATLELKYRVFTA
jgi:hypothetical protein